MKNEVVFIYGFIKSSLLENLEVFGLDQVKVSVFPYRDVAAVISRIAPHSFDSMPTETVLRKLADYQQVIESVMQTHPIIPMKFGTIVNGKEIVKRILENGYKEILKSLHETKNMVELEVVALWADLDDVLKKLGEDEEVGQLIQDTAALSPDRLTEAKIIVGKLVKSKLDQKRRECGSKILNRLKTLAEDHCIHVVKNDSMIINAGFLLLKDRIKQFENQADRLDREYQDAVNFKIIGPLPPYSFSTFEVKTVEYEDINAARRTMGLGERVTFQEIRDRYWAFVKKCHPDKFPGDNQVQARFEAITKAYHMLVDYCRDGHCSFKEADIREWVSLRLVTSQRTTI